MGFLEEIVMKPLAAWRVRVYPLISLQSCNCYTIVGEKNMARGKKTTSESLALQIAEAKAAAKKRIDAVAAAEQAAIEQLERKLEADTAEPILRPVKPERKISQKEEDILLEMAKASLRQYGTVLPPKEVLYATMDAECPHCGKVGKIATEFGFKKHRNAAGVEELKPQSWCRDCRGGKDSHPGRGHQR
jgi:hypothetical protein